MRASRILTSIFLLTLSMQLVIPRELIHGLCSHHDTEDCNVDDGYFHIGEQHEHCSIFELSMPPVLMEEELLIEFNKAAFPLFLNSGLYFELKAIFSSFNSRGPPNF